MRIFKLAHKGISNYEPIRISTGLYFLTLIGPFTTGMTTPAFVNGFTTNDWQEKHSLVYLIHVE